MKFNIASKLFTAKEVAMLLELSVLTVYKYIRNKKINAIQLGGHYRINKESLDKFIKDKVFFKNTK